MVFQKGGQKVEAEQKNIVIKNLSKAFGEDFVLKELSLTLFDGHTYCLMAPSGAGKTTLFRILMGLEKPDSGTITGLTGHRISAVFQEDRLLEDCTALQNIRLVTGHSVSSQEIETAIQRLLPKDSLGKPVREFSGGMKRRTAILRAILAPASFIIMDEPFTGLDWETKLATIRMIREYTKGRLLLISTHNAEDVDLLDGEQIQML